MISRILIQNGSGNQGHQISASFEGVASSPLPEVRRQRRSSRVRREALHPHQDGQPKVPHPDPRMQRDHAQVVGQIWLRSRGVDRFDQQEGRASSG